MSSRASLRNVEESLRHVDATFFLGKVGFLATGGKCILPAPAAGAVCLALWETPHRSAPRGRKERELQNPTCWPSLQKQIRADGFAEIIVESYPGLPGAFRVKSPLLRRHKFGLPPSCLRTSAVTLPFFGSASSSQILLFQRLCHVNSRNNSSSASLSTHCIADAVLKVLRFYITSSALHTTL